MENASWGGNRTKTTGQKLDLELSLSLRYLDHLIKLYRGESHMGEQPTSEPTMTAGHGDQQIPELGTTIHGQERYGGAGKIEQLNPTEGLQMALDALVAYLSRLNPDQLQEVKMSLENSSSANSIQKAQLQLVDAILQRKSPGA